MVDTDRANLLLHVNQCDNRAIDSPKLFAKIDIAKAGKGWTCLPLWASRIGTLIIINGLLVMTYVLPMLGSGCWVANAPKAYS